MLFLNIILRFHCFKIQSHVDKRKEQAMRLIGLFKNFRGQAAFLNYLENRYMYAFI